MTIVALLTIDAGAAVFTFQCNQARTSESWRWELRISGENEGCSSYTEHEQSKTFFMIHVSLLINRGQVMDNTPNRSGCKRKRLDINYSLLQVSWE